MFTTSAQKLRQLVPLIVSEPEEFYDRVRAKLESRTERGRTRTCAYDALSIVDGLRALDDVLGQRSAEILVERDFITRARATADRIQRLREEGPFAPAHNGDAVLGSLVYYACRALQPAVVVETGVAYGVTSACILTALARNDHGGLWSVDLPPLGKSADRYVGALVPKSCVRAGSCTAVRAAASCQGFWPPRGRWICSSTTAYIRAPTCCGNSRRSGRH